MDDGVAILFFVIFTFVGALFGHHMGTYESKDIKRECEKELPRNVECKIIAVPVDKEKE